MTAAMAAHATAGPAGRILTPDGFVTGRLIVGDDGRIAAIEADPQAPADRWLLPGFVDLHVHGGGGADTMQAGDAVRTLARTHARHGTTALLATTMTATTPEIEAALRDAAKACARRGPGEARVLGVHLEGPFLNPQRLGAQPAQAVPGTLAAYRAFAALAPIRLVTLAPEVEGHLELVAALVRDGVRVQVGHSNGTYEQGLAALQAGAAGFTHLFNAMSPLHHRAPGMAGAALAHAAHAEIIPDLLHVHPGAIRAALRAIPGLFAVTDATAAAGMPDGPYPLGAQTVHKCAGGVRLADGTLAGSALTMDQALRNLVACGLPVADAARRCASVPAAYLGLDDRGRLEPGAWADAVLLDAQTLALHGVLVEGEWLADPAARESS